MSEQFKNFPISAKESLVSIEEKTAQLVLDTQYKVRFPSKLNTHGALGIEISMIQLLGTWIKFNQHKKIFHSHQKGTSEDFKNLCNSIYGIAALSMVDEVWDSEKHQLPRKLTLAAAKNTIDALRRGDFNLCFKSRYFGVPYIKIPRYEKEFDMLFYNCERVVKSDAFYRQIEKILEGKVGESSRFENLKKMIRIEDLSDLLWEMFKNTHDHGRYDGIENIASTNFRTLIIQQMDITDDYLIGWCGEKPSDAQLEFKNNWYGNGKKHYFLDLSVIDFGAGFVDLAKQKVNYENNIQVFIQCLKKGWSRLNEINRGDGLTKILNSVHKYKGWLRIRTSNLLLEKTFSEGSIPEIETSDVCVMENYVVGTSIHISLPLQGYDRVDK